MKLARFKRYFVPLLIGCVLLELVLGGFYIFQTSQEANQLSTEAHRLSAKAFAALQSQTANRAHNVYVWCGAINQDRTYNRTFVAGVTRGLVKYSLGDLDCRALANQTLKSAKPKPAKRH